MESTSLWVVILARVRLPTLGSPQTPRKRDYTGWWWCCCISMYCLVIKLLRLLVLLLGLSMPSGYLVTSAVELCYSKSKYTPPSTTPPPPRGGMHLGQIYQKGSNRISPMQKRDNYKSNHGFKLSGIIQKKFLSPLTIWLNHTKFSKKRAEIFIGQSQKNLTVSFLPYSHQMASDSFFPSIQTTKWPR